MDTKQCQSCLNQEERISKLEELVVQLQNRINALEFDLEQEIDKTRFDMRRMDMNHKCEREW